GWTLAIWCDDDWLAQCRDDLTLTEIIPDAFAFIEAADLAQPLFFEVDRGTETVAGRGNAARDWKSKVERYGRLLNSPTLLAPLWAKLGLKGLALDEPLVLTVTTTEGRQRNLLAATQISPTPRRFWYTTEAQLQPRGVIIEAIWRVPGADESTAL